MSNFLSWFLGCITIIASLAIIIGGIIYGVLNANDRYYAAQRFCIEQGGSWIASRGDTAQCLRLK
jgi:hypothetical protein